MEVSSEALKNPSETGFIQSLLERRLHRVVLLYIGSTWTIFGIVQWVVNRYVLSPHLEELFLMMALLLLPAVLIIGYGHGKKGKQTWSRFEKMGLSCNAIVVVAALFFVFGDKDLGSAREVVQIVDNDGNEVERFVPKDVFRKRLAIFYFDNESGDEELDWMQEAITTAWDMDLEQDMFIAAQPTAIFLEKLQKAGFKDGLGVPMALKRSITSDYNMSYFVSGTIDKQGDDLVITTTLYDDKGGDVASHEYTSASVFDIIDMMSIDLKKDLDLPKQHIEDTEDLPVSELITGSEEALKATRDGLYALTVDMNFNEGLNHFKKATEIDPTFALAHIYHYQMALQQGQVQAAQQSLAQAQQHDYRLPETFQYLLKVDNLYLSGNQDLAIDAVKQWATLYPSDTKALQNLAIFHVQRGEEKEALAAYQDLLKLDPFQTGVSLEVGRLLKETGQTDEAIAHYTAFNEQYPDRNDGIKRLADVYYELGDLDKELELQMKALTVSPNDPSAVRNVGDILLRKGEFDKALQRFEAALAQSKTPQEQIASHSSLGNFYWFRGQHQDAMASFEEALNLTQTNSSAIQLQALRIRLVDRYYEIGDTDTAIEIVNAALNSPLMKQIPQFAAVASSAAGHVYAKEGNTEEALRVLADAEAFLNASGVKDLLHRILYSRAVVFIENEQYDDAIPVLESYLADNPNARDGLNRLGDVHYELGDYEAAKDSYMESLKFSPSSAMSLLGIGKSELALGNTEEAKSYLEKALKTWENADETSLPTQEARDLLAGL